MFAKHKAHLAEKKYEEEVAIWHKKIDALEACLKNAQEFSGTDSSDLILKADEKQFFCVQGAVLVGQRRAAGHYQGRSSGVSVPIGHIGHSTIRYRVGSSSGTFVPGPMVEAAIDQGTAYITNQRVVFEGSKKTLECRFDKLIGVHTDQDKGETTFSVSNRQTPTTLLYGSELVISFSVMLELAMAHYKGDVDSVIAKYQTQLDHIKADRPIKPEADQSLGAQKL